MAVEPLNPARPQLGDPVLVDEELRAIKGVLKGHEDDIGDLEDAVTDIDAVLNTFTATGKALVTAGTPDAAAQAIGAGEAGLQIFKKATLAAIVETLGLASLAPQITSGAASGGTGFTIQINTLYINILRVTVPASGLAFSWLTKFPNECMGAVATLQELGNQAVAYNGIPDATGGRIDHGNNTSKEITLIAFGR